MIRRLLALALLLVPRLAWATCDTDAYSHVICADTPKHYYRLGDTSGTTATDVGFATTINGTYTGTYTLNQTGIAGSPTNAATLFDGTSGRVELTNSVDFGIRGGSNEGSTQEGWFKAASITTGTLIGVYTGAVEVWQVVARNSAGTGQVQFKTYPLTTGCSGGTYGNIQAGDWSAGAWHHVAATTLGAGGNTLSRMRLYLDASLIGTVSSFSGTLCTSAEVATIGRLEDGILYFAATIDEVATYFDSSGTGASELTQSQVTAHYNAGITAPSAGGWPFSVKRPELPRFRDDDYFTKFASRGYHNGLFAPTVLQPKYLLVGYAPFSVVPNGRGE